jgi:transposase-like protein
MSVARGRFSKWLCGNREDGAAPPAPAAEPRAEAETPAELLDEVRRLQRENHILRRVAAYLAERSGPGQGPGEGV